MPDRRRCLVHIGLPKTGTTYLQDTLWASQAPLAEQGVAVLPQRRRDHFRLTLQLRGLLDERMDPPDAFESLDRLGREGRAFAQPTAILTNESLAPARPDQVASLLSRLDGFEVHVVVGARDPGRQIPSAWQQRIQARRTFTYAEFLEAVVARSPDASDFWANQDLPDVLTRWSAHVPAERIHVVTVPRSGGILERFCSVAGIDPSTLVVPESRDNASLGLAQAELLRQVNLALGDRLPHPRAGYTRVAREYLARRILQRQAGGRARLPVSLRSWADDLADSWIETVRQGGFHVVGSLDDLRPLEADFGEVVEPSADDVHRAAVDAIADILVSRHEEGRRKRPTMPAPSEPARWLRRIPKRVRDLR